MQLRLINIVFLLLIAVVAQAQDQVHRIAKNINKTYNYKDGYEVNIDGERAEVYIEPGLDNTIRIDVEVIAKHPSQNQAQLDVEKMRIMITRHKNKVYVRNYLEQGESFDKPESQLKVIYKILVPEDCPVYIKNTYGIAEIAQLTNSVKVNSKFSTVNLENISGNIDLMTRYGDIIGESINGNVQIGARRTNITLRDIQGNYDINAEYGLIQIFASAGLLDLNLEANKSQVFLFNSDLEEFRYDLTAVSSSLQFPDDLNFQMVSPEVNVQKMVFTPTTEFFPSISVKVTFGSLQVNKSSKVKRP